MRNLISKQSGNAQGGGIGIFGLLFVILFTLKILGVDPVAGWSWRLVTAPLWGGFLFAVIVAGIFFALYMMFDR